MASFTSYLLGYDPFGPALPSQGQSSPGDFALPNYGGNVLGFLTSSFINNFYAMPQMSGNILDTHTTNADGSVTTNPGGVDQATIEKMLKAPQETSGQKSAAYATTKAGALPKQDDGVLQWADQINAAASATGVPSYVIAAIMQGESGGDAGAKSPQGASGLMQIMPDYHADLIGKYGGNVMDPQTNILVGASILKSNFDQAKKLYGSSDADAWNIAAAAYLGDWDWKSGSYAGTADALGTTGSKYVSTFDKNLQKYQQMLQSPAAPSQVSGKSGSVIDTASQYIGNPYVWGGDSPSQGFDCSGLVQYSYKQAGVNLPRTAQEQYNATSRIDASQLQPGDLVFFTGTYNAGVPVTHVGIYVGDGKMLDSQSNGIQYDNLSDPYWQQHLYGYGRVSS